jgi:uncharacterized membrane protein YtjA (UPF0391 family)
MIGWTLAFLILAVAAALAFGGVAGAAAYVTKLLFLLFLSLFVLSLLVGRRSSSGLRR